MAAVHWHHCVSIDVAGVLKATIYVINSTLSMQNGASLLPACLLFKPEGKYLTSFLTTILPCLFWFFPGLLYYAGHGYENYGNSFMVPIDAPNPYRAAHCLCVQNILKRMQEKETGLNVFLLDMCRKRYEIAFFLRSVNCLAMVALWGYANEYR